MSSDDGERMTKIHVDGSVRMGGDEWTITGFIRHPGGKAPKDTAELVIEKDERSRLELTYSVLRKSEIEQKNRKGTAKTIAEYCKANGIEAVISEQVTSCGSAVSSQRIREMVEQGDIETANALLSRELFFEQTVQHGDMRGRTIGFPTVNQQLPGGFVVPKFGVYASHVTAGGKVYRGVTNIGIRPTFRLDNPLCETYIIGADGDMYGKSLTLSLYKFIRPERKFDSLEELQQQIEKDRNAAL